MITKTSKKFTLIIFLIIILLAAFLRFYKLGQVPSSISWDEAANGYNAWIIAHYGKDEWGKSFPLVFKSFEDDKNPVHIYITAPFVALFDLTPFGVRLPVALFGILNVILIFYLAKELFLNESIGLIATFFLAISPYALQFSRFNHEATFGLFFFLLGLVLFFQGLKQKNILLPLSFLFFGIDLISYHSAKIIVPPILILLVVFYFSKLWQVKKLFLSACFLLTIFLSVFLFNPTLLGGSRFQQTSFTLDKISQTFLYKQTKNKLLGEGEIFFNQYISHFAPNFLFVSGDKNARHSTQVVGEFYKIDALFLAVGLVGLLWSGFRKTLSRKKIFILLAWVFLAPIPASLVQEAPHAGRSLYMMGSWHLISAFGFYQIIRWSKKIHFDKVVLITGIAILGWMFMVYFKNYYQHYDQKYATEWQYGMRQVAEYAKEYNGYFQVFTTDSRHQPYIFFLFHLKTPLPTFLQTVKYNNTPSRSYNLVSSFGKYHFGDWNIIDSPLTSGFLYILTPSEYDGLKNKFGFTIKKLINYPNGANAFFIVSYP